jgi:hypothetical protein
VAIREDNKLRDRSIPAPQEWIFEMELELQEPTVSTLTIGTNYRSGSAIVATTGSGSKADSAMVAIRIINNYKSQEIRMLVHGDTKNRSGSAIVGTTGSGVKQESTVSI